MKGSKWMISAACAAVMGFGTMGCAADMPASGQTQPAQMSATHHADKDIIETATGEGMQRVTTLVTAIKAAGLVQALKGKGPFTVFAPTNEAFAKLPPGTLDDLLKPENKEKLTQILLYHVHKGDAIMAADVKTMNLKTMEGGPLDVQVDDGKVMINDAKVIKTDIVCSNGVIHWIDKVLMPPMN